MKSYCDVFDEAKLNLQRLKNHYEFLKAYVNEGSESKRKTLIKNVSREPWFVSGKHAGSRFQVNLSKQWLPFICIVPWTSRYDTLISIWIEKVAFIHDETTKIDFHT
jgi:hypothetical protein